MGLTENIICILAGVFALVVSIKGMIWTRGKVDADIMGVIFLVMFLLSFFTTVFFVIVLVTTPTP